MKKLKVLEIIGDSTLAGAPRHLLSLLENFDTKKFTLLAICPPGPLAGEIRSLKKNVDLEIIQMNSKLDFSAIKHIRKYVRRLKPDIIHIHGTRAGSVGRLAVAGLNFPVIYTEHLWTKHYKMTSRIAHRIQLIGLWFLDMFTTTNIAVSQAVKDFMIENQISREEKIVVIYNGIEPAKHHAKIFTSKDYVLGTVGTLNPQKGIQFIIQAMPQILKEFPQTKLQIVGEGTYRKHLTKMVKKMHLIKSVHFSGFVKDVDEEIDKFDIYIQASLSESFGLAIIQAMNVSIPIVATNTGGIPEVVTSNKSGILVEAAKPDALANAILKLLRDPENAKRMGKMAAEDVKIKFNLRDMVKETESLYETIAQKRSES